MIIKLLNLIINQTKLKLYNFFRFIENFINYLLILLRTRRIKNKPKIKIDEIINH